MLGVQSAHFGLSPWPLAARERALEQICGPRGGCDSVERDPAASRREVRLPAFCSQLVRRGGKSGISNNPPSP